MPFNKVHIRIISFYELPHTAAPFVRLMMRKEEERRKTKCSTGPEAYTLFLCTNPENKIRWMSNRIMEYTICYFFFYFFKMLNAYEKVIDEPHIFSFFILKGRLFFFLLFLNLNLAMVYTANDVNAKPEPDILWKMKNRKPKF